MGRTKAWLFLIAFSVIGTLTVIEGVNDGWTVLNWLILAVSIIFALQSVWILTRSDVPRA
jgi:hypothetical protein